MRLSTSLLILLLVILTACGEEVETPERAINYGLTLEPSGFDPHINQSSELGIIFRQVYDTLVYRDPTTREIVPGLATSWGISEDGLSYTFTLRDDVVFHDGTPFNAQAVAANLERIFDTSDPGLASQRSRFMLGSFNGYDIIDDNTIRLRLSQPYSPLLDSLSQVYLGVGSPAAFEEYGRDVYQFYQVGTGPYILEEFVPGDRIVLRINPDYTWGPAFMSRPDNAPQQITYRFYTDPATRRPVLEAQEVDVIGELVPTDARSLVGSSDFRILPTPVAGQPLQFLMNTTQYPTDNTTFRQALIYATSREEIVDTVFQGFSPVAWGPLTANTLYYSRDMQGVYPHNAQEARDLLASIGFEDMDGNGFLDTPEGDLEVVIVHASWGFLPETVQLIQDQWREIGVRAVLEPVAGFPALIARANEGDYNLIAFNSFGYDPSLLNEYFLSNGSNNFTNFRSPELDELLLQATRELSPSVRRGLYGQIQAAIMNQALILPIRDYVNLNAASSTVQGLEFDAYGWHPVMNNVSILNES